MAMAITKLMPGDFVPKFIVNSNVTPEFHFDQVGGKRIVLCCFGTAQRDVNRLAFENLVAQIGRLVLDNTYVIGLSMDPHDVEDPRLARMSGLVTIFWDMGGAVSRALGVLTPVEGRPGAEHFRAASVLIDENMRLVARLPLGEPDTHGQRVLDAVAALVAAPRVEHPPILIIPDVFDPDFCARLIALHRADNCRTGQMSERYGRTYGVVDLSRKSRTDHAIADPEALSTVYRRFNNRVHAEIAKVHQYRFTRLERYLVANYDAADGGCFEAHRDNTTRGTAHRAFAVSIALNDDYQGGGVRFAEYSQQAYRAPVGGAVVFSTSLMHEVVPVAAGRRYVFLTFVYDEAGEELRRRNACFVDCHVAEPA